MLGSVSFDGSLRIWNLQNMTMKDMITDRLAKGNENVLQSLVWSPLLQKANDPPNSNVEDLVVTLSSQGTINLIDVGRRKVI